MAKSYAYVGAPSFIGAVEGRLADAGFSQVSDVASADIVVTYATSGSALEDLYFGDEGLVTTTAPGSTLVDLSAATPNFAREINAVATVNDLIMVEAPATVRSLVAADAFARENLLGPVATEAELTDDVRRLLDAIFGEVVEVGAPGRAQLLRNTHTLPLAADLVSAIEAVALDDASARSVGALDADQIPLFSPVSADPVVQAVRQQRYTGDYTAEMLLAELSAALMAADDAEVILPGVEATMHLLEASGGHRRRRYGAGGAVSGVSGRGGRSPGRARLDARRAGLWAPCLRGGRGLERLRRRGRLRPRPLPRGSRLRRL